MFINNNSILIKINTIKLQCRVNLLVKFENVLICRIFQKIKIMSHNGTLYHVIKSKNDRQNSCDKIESPLCSYDHHS